MKKFSIILPMIALIIGVTASAFTHVRNTDPDRVWFKTNQTGVIISEGQLSQNPPPGMDCPGNTYLCAAAFSTDQVQLVNGHYELKSGVTVDDRIDETNED